TLRTPATPRIGNRPYKCPRPPLPPSRSRFWSPEGRYAARATTPVSPARGRRPLGTLIAGRVGRRPDERRVGGQLAPGVHAEFAVDPAEVGLDRLDRDERGGGHLAVGHPARDQPGDALLGGRQLADRAALQAEAAQLRARSFGPDRRAQAGKQLLR